MLYRFAVIFLILFSASPAFAQAGPRGNAPSRAVPAGKVQLEIMVVHATKQHSQWDAKVGKYRKYLQHLAYTGYTSLRNHSLVLAPNKVERIELAGGRKVIVNHKEMREELGSGFRSLVPKGGKLLDSTMNVSRNSSDRGGSTLSRRNPGPSYDCTLLTWVRSWLNATPLADG